MKLRKPVRTRGGVWTDVHKEQFKKDYDNSQLDNRALSFLYAVSESSIRGLAHKFLAGYRKAPISKEEIIWLKANVDSFVSYADAADKLNAVFGNGRNRTSANRTFKKIITLTKPLLK